MSLFSVTQGAWKPQAGSLDTIKVNGKFCNGFTPTGQLGPVHGDMNLEPMMEYKFFEKFALLNLEKHIKLNLKAPQVNMIERNANFVCLDNGQCLNPAFYDYYAMRYTNSEMRSAGKQWPVIWVKDNQLMGFVCPIDRSKRDDTKKDAKGRPLEPEIAS